MSARKPKLPAYTIRQLEKLAEQGHVLYVSVEDGVASGSRIVNEIKWLTVDDGDEYDDAYGDESPVLAVYCVDDCGGWRPVTVDDQILVAAPVRIK